MMKSLAEWFEGMSTFLELQGCFVCLMNSISHGNELGKKQKKQGLQSPGTGCHKWVFEGHPKNPWERHQQKQVWYQKVWPNSLARFTLLLIKWLKHTEKSWNRKSSNLKSISVEAGDGKEWGRSSWWVTRLRVDQPARLSPGITNRSGLKGS